MKTLYLILAAALLLSRAATEPLSESEHYRQAALLDPEFRPAEKIKYYRSYNFGPLLTRGSRAATSASTDVVVGFIGPHCQRLQIRFLSVRQDTANLARYYVTGKAKTLGHLSDFSGMLVLQQVRELRQLSHPGEAIATVESEKFAGAKREGFCLAAYELRENSGQPQAGVFRGVARTNWFVNRQGQLRYDYAYNSGDGYCNNQFVGTWTSYTTHQTLRCNWGDYRIPDAGDFDIGAGEFSPAAKYLAYGWQDVAGATYGNNAAARKRESQPWWK